MFILVVLLLHNLLHATLNIKVLLLLIKKPSKHDPYFFPAA